MIFLYEGVHFVYTHFYHIHIAIRILYGVFHFGQVKDTHNGRPAANEIVEVL